MWKFNDQMVEHHILIQILSLFWQMLLLNRSGPHESTKEVTNLENYHQNFLRKPMIDTHKQGTSYHKRQNSPYDEWKPPKWAWEKDWDKWDWRESSRNKKYMAEDCATRFDMHLQSKSQAVEACGSQETPHIYWVSLKWGHLLELKMHLEKGKKQWI